MRGLPEMRTPIMEEQAIPATEDELAKRRAAALRAWLEREMGTERAALTALLAKWGACTADDPTACFADLDGDGVVGGTDLTIILSAWGDCG